MILRWSRRPCVSCFRSRWLFKNGGGTVRTRAAPQLLLIMICLSFVTVTDVFYIECAHSAQCAPYKHHLDECIERVTRQEEDEDYKGPKEDCVEECKFQWICDCLLVPDIRLRLHWHPGELEKLTSIQSSTSPTALLPAPLPNSGVSSNKWATASPLRRGAHSSIDSTTRLSRLVST